jgi:hypothetical protein
MKPVIFLVYGKAISVPFQTFFMKMGHAASFSFMHLVFSNITETESQSAGIELGTSE